MPKITVLMPVYNSEKYVSEAIESILTQTFSDFEFLIIQHCSIAIAIGVAFAIAVAFVISIAAAVAVATVTAFAIAIVRIVIATTCKCGFLANLLHVAFQGGKCES